MVFSQARKQIFLVQCPLANIKSLYKKYHPPNKAFLPLDLKLQKHLLTVKKKVKSFAIKPYFPAHHSMSSQAYHTLQTS